MTVQAIVAVGTMIAVVLGFGWGYDLIGWGRGFKKAIDAPKVGGIDRKPSPMWP
ncbi:MAG: hypothetical protein QF797_19835 [Alphaproteobacteria bacterium]|jgi:hypothetical protein|nr:hypothetical protein [Alphaproteobacteria bacterium]|tara:strand:- start:286 stop:447 length:162 start_codon:yes stop_codon:yes gene_type:complete